MVSINNSNKFSSAETTLNELLSYSGESFIQKAYTNLLRRPPDAIGFQYYIARLNTGVTKGRILLQLATSLEARAFADNFELIELIKNRYENASRYGLLSRYTKKILPRKITDSKYLQGTKVSLIKTNTVEFFSNNLKRTNNKLNMLERIILQQTDVLDQQAQLIQQISKLITSLTDEAIEEKNIDHVEMRNPSMSMTEKNIFKQLKLSIAAQKGKK